MREAPDRSGASLRFVLLSEPYGVGGGKSLAELLIVRSDLSQRVVVEPSTPGSLGMKVADQEMIVLDVR